MNIRYVVAVSLVLVGCSRDPSYEKVFQHPMNEWEERAAKLPNQELIDAYVYGLTDRRPPVVLAVPVAARGVKLFEDLASLSIKRKDDYIMSSLIQIADRIESDREGAICRSPSAMKLLSEAGRDLKTKILKDSFAQDFASLCVKARK